MGAMSEEIIDMTFKESGGGLTELYSLFLYLLQTIACHILIKLIFTRKDF